MVRFDYHWLESRAQSAVEWGAVCDSITLYLCNNPEKRKVFKSKHRDAARMRTERNRVCCSAEFHINYEWLRPQLHAPLCQAQRSLLNGISFEQGEEGEEEEALLSHSESETKTGKKLI